MLWGHLPVLKELIKDYIDLLLLLTSVYVESSYIS